MEADLLQLNEKLNRFRHRHWEKLFRDNKMQDVMRPESLKSIDVQVKILLTGKYKY